LSRLATTPVAAVVLCTGATLAALLAIPPQNAPGHCAAAIRFRGNSYSPVIAPGGYPKPIRSGRILQGARVPSCTDTPSAGPTPTQNRQIEVRAIRGVHPAIGVVSRDPSLVRGEVVFAAAGFFLSLPSHPLHSVVRDPVESRQPRRKCVGPFRAAGVSVGYADFESVLFEVSTASTALRQAIHSGLARFDVERATEIFGSRRLGLPFVPPNARLRAHVLRCRHVLRGGALAATPFLVARDVWVSPPT
jgi:hypothetical protein